MGEPKEIQRAWPAILRPRDAGPNEANKARLGVELSSSCDAFQE